MHKQNSGRDRRFRDYANADGDPNDPQFDRGRKKFRHARLKYYEKFAGTNRFDWFEDADRDSN
jgi:hypothetical protein